eukprot:gene9184-12403_t
MGVVAELGERRAGMKPDKFVVVLDLARRVERTALDEGSEAGDIVAIAGHRRPARATDRSAAHLDAMNRIGGLPWPLTFSYGRALQAAPQKAWSGKAENIAAGQQAFTHRARMNSLASKGAWVAALETNKAA